MDTYKQTNKRMPLCVMYECINQLVIILSINLSNLQTRTVLPVTSRVCKSRAFCFLLFFFLSVYFPEFIIYLRCVRIFPKTGEKKIERERESVCEEEREK